MKKSKSLFRKSLFLFIIMFTISVSISAALDAPDFSLSGEGDTVYKLGDYKGKTLILFFFSFSCPHCERAMPAIKEVYKNAGGRYEMLGVVYGTPKEDLRYKKIETGAEFEVAVGTREVGKDYHVGGTPYIWVIGPGGTLRERFVGENGGEMLKEYLNPPQYPSRLELPPTPSLAKRGSERVGLFELSSDPKTYEGRTIETEGRLAQASLSYFPKPVFKVTNGADKITVSAWLPLEVAPAPKGINKERKKVMSDFIGKYVKISGKVVLEDGKPVIEVKDARTE